MNVTMKMLKLTVFIVDHIWPDTIVAVYLCVFMCILISLSFNFNLIQIS